MADILLEWAPAAFSADWVFTQGGVAPTQTGLDDLRNAVLVSLFTWRVPPVGYTGPMEGRGWFGDTYNPSPIGSLLWMLLRAKKSDAAATLRNAKVYCTQALQWLIDDKVASAITVNTFWLSATQLGITISIQQASGATAAFAWTWQGS